MPASYPLAVRVFPRRPVDEDTVFAEDVTSLQDEVLAIQSVLGVTPQISTVFPGLDTVDDRLTAGEQSFDGRLTDLEETHLRASVSATRLTTQLISSSTSWQVVTLTDIVTGSLVDPYPDDLYDAATSRFYARGVTNSIWSMAATISWASDAGTNRRGLRIIGSDGRVLTSRTIPAIPSQATPVSVSWTGVLPADYSLFLQCYQDSGAALNILANTNTNPTRVDFTRIPG